ncbi:MAG: GWxTD domain-containing protein [Bacteroidota bacterium]
MRTFILCVIFLISQFISLRAQEERRAEHLVTDNPDYYLDAMSFRSDDSSAARIDIYAQVPFNELQFVTVDSGFIARYEITIDILTLDGNAVLEKTWNQEVHVHMFDETQSRKEYSTTAGSFKLAPDDYEMRAELREGDSRKASLQTRKIHVQNYAETPFSVSDIMLVNEVTKEGKQSTIVPNVSGNLYDLPHGFSFFFELYNQAGADSAALTYRVFDRKEKLIYTQSEHRRLDGKKSEVIAKIDSARFPAGSYHLDITAETIRNSDSAPTYKSEKRRDFVMRWGSVPLTMDDLELAIKETKYIASSKEYNAMMDAPTLVEKQKLFREFWSKRDPSEGAQRNINMDEYYSRVQYSNDHFSHFIEGWRTDMGMVFILFGAPNTIDRHPFEIDSKPYEVWTYYDINTQIVFLDETGFGDYRLVTPIWDLVQHTN